MKSGVNRYQEPLCRLVASLGEGEGCLQGRHSEIGSDRYWVVADFTKAAW